MTTRIYSDVWHQVADLQLELVNQTRIFKQFYRGELWYVFQDVYSNKFFRLTPEAYHFLLQLSAEQTLGTQWESYLQAYPEDAPTQDEVVRLLSHLHLSNLLYYRNRSATDSMFDRVQDKRQKELRAKLASFLFVRIPLWNPERWLKHNVSLINLLFNRFTALIWLITGIFAGKTVLDNSDRLWAQSQGVLALDNLVYLYLCMFILKLLHEFGHAMMTKKFGGTVSTMGVMLLILTPIPYMDASSSWAFRNKYHRVLVGGAGMLVELYVAFLATFIWAATGEGFLHSLAFNVMLIASVSSLIFNGNPLLKFDAYYMLSDWFEVPNLYQRSRDQWYYWIERFAFGVKQGMLAPAQYSTEQFWLAVYALLSLAYRLVVSVSIVFFVAGEWFLLGMLIAVLFIYMWLMKPMGQMLNYLFTGPRLLVKRKRALIVAGLFAGLVFSLLAWLPVPSSIRAPGVVQADEFYTLYSPVDGLLASVDVHSGQALQTGDVLATIKSRDLEVDRDKAKQQLVEVDVLINAALNNKDADLAPLQQRRALLERQLSGLEDKLQQARLTAEHEGIYIGDELTKLKGTWLNVRERLGVVINPKGYHFSAIVQQDQLSQLFLFAQAAHRTQESHLADKSSSAPISSVARVLLDSQKQKLNTSIRLYGDAGQEYIPDRLRIVPFEQHKLPSAALGWRAGGPIATLETDEYGLTAQEAFFRVEAEFDDLSAGTHVLHGRTGILRIRLPDEPIAQQLYRAFNQLLQRRFLL